MLAVAAVLAATLTLLPAVLGRLGTRVNAGRLIGRRSSGKRPAGSTTACMHGGTCCGAIHSPPGWPPSACFSWPRCPCSACAPTCPPSRSCRPTPTRGWATTRSPGAFGPAPRGSCRSWSPPTVKTRRWLPWPTNPVWQPPRPDPPTAPGPSTRSSRPPGRPPPPPGATIDRLRQRATPRQPRGRRRR